MAENVTPVVLAIDGFAEREVMMVDYKFGQATDREGQIAGIPRGGKVNVRVKAMNDGNNELSHERWQQRADSLDARPHKSQEFLSEVREHRRRCIHEGAEGHQHLLHQLR